MFALLTPSRGRPQSFQEMIETARDTASEPFEVVAYLDNDDPQLQAYREVTERLEHQVRVKLVVGPRITLTQTWNEAFKFADVRSDIFMQNSDDMRFRAGDWAPRIREVFERFDDHIVFTFPHDGHWGGQFGVNGFVHRDWIDAVGYFTPPYFSCDYGDTWLNDVAKKLGRWYFVDVLIEHLHPVWGTFPFDQTHAERTQRGANDGVNMLYESVSMVMKRDEDVAKLRAVMNA